MRIEAKDKKIGNIRAKKQDSKGKDDKRLKLHTPSSLLWGGADTSPTISPSILAFKFVERFILISSSSVSISVNVSSTITVLLVFVICLFCFKFEFCSCLISFVYNYYNLYKM